MKTQLNAILQYCQNHQVDIVANQKVFEEDFCQLFLENDILVLPRLGLKGIQMLKKMTKCDVVLTSIEQTMVNNNNSKSVFIREIDRIEVVEISGKCYLELKTENSLALTLVMYSWNEDSCDELKVRRHYFFYVKRFSLQPFIRTFLHRVSYSREMPGKCLK